jgi:hypothetical protein
MDKISRKSGNARSGNTTKYDAHHRVLTKTYGTLADLRRELSDSKAAVRYTQYFCRLRRFAARLAPAGGLLRKTLARSEGFCSARLVAAFDGFAR